MIIYQKSIKRSDLKNNPKALYIFGDNHWRKGLGGQAKEMRGEPNAFGIRTKKTTYDCFEDTVADMLQFKTGVDVDIEQLKIAGNWDGAYFCKTIVFPSDGIGTGLARLPKNLLTYLNNELLKVGIQNGITA